MRKLAAYGAAGLLALSAMAGGVSYAQDATAEAPSTAEVAPTVAQRTWLGVAVSEDENGVIITRIAAGSPAETAQLAVGDVIVAVNDTPIASADDLHAVIEAAAPGDAATLTVSRDGADVSVEVTLSAQEGRGGMRGMGMPADPLEIAQHALGVTLEAVDGGYQVVSVEDGAVFELEAGDVITAVNGEAIDTLDWRSLKDPTTDSTTVTLTVERGGEEVTLTGELTMFGGHRGGNHPGENGQPNNNGNDRPNGNRPPNGSNNGQPGGAPPPADGTTV